VEDAAQAHCASLGGRPVGAFGEAGCFSFYPTKNMTSGEGGMVTAAGEDVARMVRLLRNQGMQKRYENEVVGFNTRMTDLHAAIGRVQLGKLEGWTKQRQANARFLDENLAGVVVPPVADGAVHVYHQYTIRVVGHDRDAFAAALHETGVGSGVYYPIPTHRLPSFALDLDLPETERAAREVLSLPVHPALSDDDLTVIVEAVNAAAQAGA
jgi:dTDP-4-amino-4,6-dideoxygalactose transaminase